VIEPGLYTTVQDYPGRVGYWDVGIPPSGPMDSFSFRCANWLVGNPASSAGLELTMTGPTIKFHVDAIIAICGADMAVALDSRIVPIATATPVRRGETLSIGRPKGAGARSYLAFQSGLKIAPYLGSKSTFPNGALGGHKGRPLIAGDYIEIVDADVDESRIEIAGNKHLPFISNEWSVGAIPGPYAAPDYFLKEDLDAIYSAAFKVHYNSNRLGYRLIGPKPRFAREDGGEGGRHPSNLHDYVYGVGTVNFTGDMPIVIGVDGPSLGGFTSAVTIPDAELWKIGQASAGDTIRFSRWSVGRAVRARRARNRLFRSKEPKT